MNFNILCVNQGTFPLSAFYFVSEYFQMNNVLKHKFIPGFSQRSTLRKSARKLLQRKCICLVLNGGLCCSPCPVLRQLHHCCVTQYCLVIYGPCVILQYICDPTDTQCFVIEFIHNSWWLDMFRT